MKFKRNFKISIENTHEEDWWIYGSIGRSRIENDQLSNFELGKIYKLLNQKKYNWYKRKKTFIFLFSCNIGLIGSLNFKHYQRNLVSRQI